MKTTAKLTVLFVSALLLLLLGTQYYRLMQEDVAFNQLKYSFNNQQPSSPKHIENSKYQELSLRQRSRNRDLSDEALNQIREDYYQALQRKPSWPYFYSGIVQAEARLKQLDFENIQKSMRLGKHEVKVVKSLAELLFYRWNDFTTQQRSQLLNYLSSQYINNVNNAATLASRSGRLYEFCDHLYEKQGVENHVCRSNYWKPLVKVEPE